MILSGSRLLVHAQVDGRMDRRTDKHNVFNRRTTGFLLHNSSHAQFAVNENKKYLFLDWLSLIMKTLGTFKMSGTIYQSVRHNSPRRLQYSETIPTIGFGCPSHLHLVILILHPVLPLPALVLAWCHVGAPTHRVSQITSHIPPLFPAYSSNPRRGK